MSGTTRSERTEPRSGCIESHWRLNSISLAGTRLFPRSHLLLRRFCAASGNRPKSKPSGFLGNLGRHLALKVGPPPSAAGSEFLAI